MFEKRCSLCGGKLRENICTECGLDNSKSDANYVSSGSTHRLGEGMTHEHKDNENPMAGKTVTKDWIDQEKRAAKARRQGTGSTNSQTYQSAGRSTSTYQSSAYQSTAASTRSGKKKKHSLFGIVILIFILFSVVSSIFGAIRTSYEEWDSKQDSYWESGDSETEAEYDPYGYAERELSEDGETYDIDLSAGVYKGGVHIPEGRYTVECLSEDGNAASSYMELSLNDDENSIYIHEYFEEGETIQIEDLRVYEEAILEVEGRGILKFHSENAQVGDMQFLSNPNTKSYEVKESFVVGKDVEPGVYDVICKSGSGIFDYSVEHEDGYEIYCGKLIGDDNSGFAGEKKNIVLPKGVTVDITGMTVELIPSESIESEDYEDFFDNY